MSIVPGKSYNKIINVIVRPQNAQQSYSTKSNAKVFSELLFSNNSE